MRLGFEDGEGWRYRGFAAVEVKMSGDSYSDIGAERESKLACLLSRLISR
jgi:hypothetical protein